MDRVAIRPGDTRDLDDIARIAVASWISTGLAAEGESGIEDRRSRFAGQLASGCLLYLAERDGEPLGFVILDPADNYLAQLFVSPGHQGRGIGRALLGTARGHMRDEIWLKTPADNRAAIAWYEREGFVKEREADQPGPPRRIVSYYRWRAGEP